MYIVHVFVSVTSSNVDNIKQATIENAQHSIKEPGVVRFDVIQQINDPQKFVLVEVYKDENAPLAHKETEHYKKWRDAVEEMMAEPRKSIKYRDNFFS